MIPEMYNHEMIQRCFEAMRCGIEKEMKKTRSDQNGPGLYMAVGGLYKCLEECTDSFHQARMALKTRSSRLIFCEELGFLYFLLDRKKEVSDYAVQKLTPLIVYDRESQGELLTTLKAYFHNNENVEKTAAALYIHRNTLNKRLKKAEELLNLNLRTTREKMILYECLRVLELF